MSKIGSPNHTISRTFQAKFKLPNRKKCSRKNKKNPKKQYRNPIFLALEWQNMMKGGDVASKAELARKLGISRARVTQIMNVLNLDSELLKMIVDVGDPHSYPSISEKNIRSGGTRAPPIPFPKARKILKRA